jgi:hypothetical protein
MRHLLKFVNRFIWIASALTVLGIFSHAQQQGPPPRYFDERFVIKAMAQINGAQATYRAITGTGSFGSLMQLHSAGFIDTALASGQKYGYSFVVSPGTNTFMARATPINYRKSGLRSYYIDQRGVLFGGDTGGLPASDSNAPYVDACALWGISDNERCTIGAMRLLHGSQITFATTIGNGEYGETFQELHVAGLIDMVLAVGLKHGYQYQMESHAGPPATFRIWAMPIKYGETGIRSFFVDETGVVRGADRQGGPAGSTDPPVEP